MQERKEWQHCILYEEEYNPGLKVWVQYLRMPVPERESFGLIEEGVQKLGKRGWELVAIVEVQPRDMHGDGSMPRRITAHYFKRFSVDKG